MDAHPIGRLPCVPGTPRQSVAVPRRGLEALVASRPCAASLRAPVKSTPGVNTEA